MLPDDSYDDYKNVEETSSWSSSCNVCDIITLNISYMNVQVL